VPSDYPAAGQGAKQRRGAGTICWLSRPSQPADSQALVGGIGLRGGQPSRRARSSTRTVWYILLRLRAASPAPRSTMCRCDRSSPSRLDKSSRRLVERVPDSTQVRSGNAGVFAPKIRRLSHNFDSLQNIYQPTCQSQTPRDFEQGRSDYRPLRASRSVKGPLKGSTLLA
jgi:hypothetical protein